jgi:protein-S-isoprenylcysteine O-methyltransferase Ste14
MATSQMEAERRSDAGTRPTMSGAGAQLILVAAMLLIIAALFRWRENGWGALAWLAMFVVMTAIRLPHATRNRSNRVVTARKWRDDVLLLGGMFATMMLLPLLHLATGTFAFADYRLPDGATAIGAVALLPMLWLFWRSHADLGRNWSPGLEVREGHDLVTDGVYARWRHPMYVAIWLAVLAQPLLIHNVVGGMLAIPAFAAMWWLRVPQEEAMLRDRFGEAYDAYCARVGRLWPRVRS